MEALNPFPLAPFPTAPPDPFRTPTRSPPGSDHLTASLKEILAHYSTPPPPSPLLREKILFSITHNNNNNNSWANGLKERESKTKSNPSLSLTPLLSGGFSGANPHKLCDIWVIRGMVVVWEEEEWARFSRGRKSLVDSCVVEGACLPLLLTSQTVLSSLMAESLCICNA